MQTLQWNSITPNFSGSNQESSNATRDFALAGSVANGIHRNILANAALDEQKKKDALALQQQAFSDSLATQANNRAQYIAEAKGMNQGDLVADAMKNITINNRGLDNTNAMQHLSDTYKNVGTNSTLTNLNNQIDAYDKANGTTVQNGVIQRKNGATVKSILGKNYNLYTKLQNAANKNIQTVNNNVVSNGYSSLFKTADKANVQNTLYNQLTTHGVNPVYAAAVAKTKASEYTTVTPKMSDAVKQQIKYLNGIEKTSAGNTTTSSITTGSNTGLGKNNGSKNSNNYVDMTKPQNQAKLTSAITTATKALGIKDSKVPWHNDLSIINQYMSAAHNGVRPTDAKGNTLLQPNGKPYPLVYPTQDNVVSALTAITENHFWSDNSLKDVNTFKKQMAMNAGYTIVRNGGTSFYTKGNASINNRNSKKMTTTVKGMTPAAQHNYLEAVNAEQNILNQYHTPTGKDIADQMTGTVNGKIAGVTNLDNLVKKLTTRSVPKNKIKPISTPTVSKVSNRVKNLFKNAKKSTTPKYPFRNITLEPVINNHHSMTNTTLVQPSSIINTNPRAARSTIYQNISNNNNNNNNTGLIPNYIPGTPRNSR